MSEEADPDANIIFGAVIDEKLQGELAVNVIFGSVPLQMLAAETLVTCGVGLTVTVIVKEFPEQAPTVEIGVIIY